MVEILTSMCIGYFLGSIPFALVIGKVFYHTDIRQYGSKNLGGGNAGRVLGKKAGLFVMTLDGGYSFLIFFFPLLVFLGVLYLWKIISLASMVSAAANTIYLYFTVESKLMVIASLVFAIVIIVRHRKNIDRMLKNEENKIKWM